MTSSEVRLARIALGCLVEPGNRELGLLVRAVGPVGALDRIVTGTVSERLREAVAVRLREVPEPLDIAAAALERADRLGARIVTPEEEEWPGCLADLVGLSRENGPGGPGSEERRVGKAGGGGGR